MSVTKYANPNLSTSQFARQIACKARQQELIRVLRRVAFLCSLEHQDEPRLNERTRIARLMARVDGALHKLLAEQAR
jgi:hypothetical protein